MKVTAVVPVKTLADAKSRLGTVLGPARRRELVLEMLAHVLGTVRDARVSRLVVVTRDETVGSIAVAEGGDWIPDPAETLNASLAVVFRACREKGEAPLFLPADLPRLDASDVGALVDLAADGKIVVLSPSRDEKGTNALLVPAAHRMEPLLGARSFLRHLTRAKRLGIPTRVYRSAGIGLDIDTPEDLLMVSDSPARNPEAHAR